MTTMKKYNPRCLRRDLTMAASAFFTDANFVNLTVGAASGSIQPFQEELQGSPGTVRML